MNNSVYVNDKTKKFFNVINNEDYGYFEINILKDEGFHFIDYFDNKEKKAILDEIHSLSVVKMIKLLKKLENKWKLMKNYRFNLMESKLEYLQEYYDEPGYEMEFDQEDFLSWLKEGYLPDWFNSIDYDDLDIILSFLKENTDNFYYEFLRGYVQGDYCYVWSNNINNQWNPDREYMEDIAYSSWVSICESNEEGEIGEVIEDVPGYYLAYGREDIYLSKYMQKKYGARLAKENILYY